jgi:hypothetical protein
MLYNDKIQTHLRRAEENAKKAESFLQKGQKDKSNHYKRISEAHYRNALFYRKHSQIISLAMAF